ncbi:hypothetical protein [Marinobacter oulmenensis]|uniref:Uncharacterized protein n=1 Tax=Marinobacter oulmenensis TaxID=643747 RepID=A0A840UE06_9GAMM|nr:hypothetical protein [Marinobacter oulmenensis]MBB5321610.1 hypothetical protein [Marinobacter oulmenensis]
MKAARVQIATAVFLLILVAAFGLMMVDMNGEKDTSVRIGLQSPGTTWSFGSKQKLSWSVEGSSSGSHQLVIYLENRDTGRKGFIASQPVGNGSGEANYVVNAYTGPEGEPRRLENGSYTLEAAVYRASDDATVDYGYGQPGDRVAEQDFGEIRVVNSDVRAE